MNSIRHTAILLPLLGLAGVVGADEGMWMPQQIPALADRLAAMGFAGDPQAFADLTGQPMGAIVSLGGCSASFVSPEGLIVTNHHCVIGALQFNATAERNLIEDGFVARTREEELPNGPGSRVYVTTQVLEVTDDLNRRLKPSLSDRARFDLIERWSKERTAACEKDGSRCRVSAFFSGLRWFEIKQIEIRDVRLVYAPPSGIGNFGGETDNWRWPRHTGDFGFFRAYVGSDGKPAPYAKENVPYRPKRWLKVSPKGAGAGDLVFVVGYPGFTERHQIHAEIAETTEWQLPRSIRRAEEQIAILDELAGRGPELGIKVEARRRGLHNGLTRNRGVLDGLVRGGALETKRTRERDLEAWIASDPERARELGDVLPALNALQADAARTRERDAVFQTLVGGNSSLLGAADTLHQMGLQRPKKDFDREPEFQERNWNRIRDGLERAQRTLDPLVDRAMLRYQLLEASRLAADQRIASLDRAAGLAPGMSEADAAKAIDAFLDRLYAGTRLFDKEYRLSLLEKSTEELRATRDPFLELAAALYPFEEQLRDTDKTRRGARYRLAPRYMNALLAKSGGLVAPDANGTLRVTFGRVEGVDSRDGVFFKPQTTLAGIVEKQNGEKDFTAPARQLEAIRALRAGKATPYLDPVLHDVPVNFLSMVDTTGGNSGSATLNARGELCGLLFDGTYDTVVSDIVFDPVRTRSIHLDSRYLLWVLSEVDGANADPGGDGVRELTSSSVPGSADSSTWDSARRLRCAPTRLRRESTEHPGVSSGPPLPRSSSDRRRSEPDRGTSRGIRRQSRLIRFGRLFSRRLTRWPPRRSRSPLRERRRRAVRWPAPARGGRSRGSARFLRSPSALPPAPGGSARAPGGARPLGALRRARFPDPPVRGASPGPAGARAPGRGAGRHRRGEDPPRRRGEGPRPSRSGHARRSIVSRGPGSPARWPTSSRTRDRPGRGGGTTAPPERRTRRAPRAATRPARDLRAKSSPGRLR